MWTRSEYDKIKHLMKDESLCPFCKKNRSDQELLWEGKYWAILYNKYPYLGLRKHLLVVPNSHVWLTSEITPEEWTEMQEMEKWMYNFYEGKPYFSFIRQIWQMKSIKHLHYHYLPGEVEVKPIEDMLRLQNL
jgi:diadenosine tetraphosphate (Ap4A) HIT family hydrolase